MPHRAKAFNRTYPASSDSEFPPSRSPSPGAGDVEMNYGGGAGRGTGAGAGGSATGNESDEYGGAYESDEPHTHHRRHLMPPAPSYTSYSRHKRRSATTPASSSSPSASSSTSMGTKWTADEYLQLLDHVLVYGTAKSGFATAVPGRNKNQAYQAWRSMPHVSFAKDARPDARPGAARDRDAPGNAQTKAKAAHSAAHTDAPASPPPPEHPPLKRRQSAGEQVAAMFAHVAEMMSGGKQF